MGREPPLTDYELRKVRALILEGDARRAVDVWLQSRWRFAAMVAGLASAAAVLTASVIEIARSVG